MPSLQGPRDEIRWRRDALGYPSVEATDLAHATWARGWFHAVDRLAQIQLSLMVARGGMQALLGPVPLARHADRMTRIHRFTDDLDEQVSRLSPDMRALVDAYCGGFNAGVEHRGWPLLLRALGVRRAAYRPRDMILMYRIVSWFGLTSLAEMPPLLVGELAAGGASARDISLLLGDAMAPGEVEALSGLVWPPELRVVSGSPAGGSNGIVIAGSRSASGGALLIGDPHMEIARIPPVLYAMHASLPSGEYLQGLGIPGVAWPSFGRTAHVGWTYTYGHGAAVDVRAVRCRGGEYFDGAEWRPLAQRRSVVKVKGAPDETWTFWDGDLGTVVGAAEEPREVTLPCIRWAGLRETHRDLDAIWGLLHARDLARAIAVHREIATISLDAMLADSSGRVGHILTGSVDRRAGRAGGVVPAAPEGPTERLPESSRPHTVDPPRGFIVSANVRPPEPGGAAWVPMPEPGARHARLTHLVEGATNPLELGDLARFVRDACDAGAARLLPVWAPLLPDHPRAKRLASWAAEQPGSGAEHFAQLTLWACLYEALCRRVLSGAVGEKSAARIVDDLGALLVFEHHLDAALALERPELLDGAALRKHLAAVFPAALERADRDEARLPRREPFRNIFFGGKLSALGFDSPPVENPGGPTTPNQVATLTFGGQRLVFGAAGRFLCDMSQPGGWYCMSGGASERRLGPGYKAGLEAWGRGDFAPLGPARGTAPTSRKSSVDGIRDLSSLPATSTSPSRWPSAPT